jgi:hypothetical protein
MSGSELWRSWTDNSTGAVVQNVQHYDGDEDSPVWTQEGPDRWTRGHCGHDSQW